MASTAAVKMIVLHWTYILAFLVSLAIYQVLQKTRDPLACGCSHAHFLFLLLDKVVSPCQSWAVKFFDMPIGHSTDEAGLDKLIHAQIDV